MRKRVGVEVKIKSSFSVIILLLVSAFFLGCLNNNTNTPSTDPIKEELDALNAKIELVSVIEDPSPEPFESRPAANVRIAYELTRDYYGVIVGGIPSNCRNKGICSEDRTISISNYRLIDTSGNYNGSASAEICVLGGKGGIPLCKSLNLELNFQWPGSCKDGSKPGACTSNGKGEICSSTKGPDGFYRATYDCSGVCGQCDFEELANKGFVKIIEQSQISPTATAPASASSQTRRDMVVNQYNTYGKILQTDFSEMNMLLQQLYSEPLNQTTIYNKRSQIEAYALKYEITIAHLNETKNFLDREQDILEKEGVNTVQYKADLETYRITYRARLDSLKDTVEQYVAYLSEQEKQKQEAFLNLVSLIAKVALAG